MVRPLFAAGQVLLAALLTMPGCGKSERNDTVSPGVRAGQIAPDVEEKDLDGEPIKLSEHRGKVVALSFWASWCPPCRMMIPHERALIEKNQGKPFVFLGVNGDHEREAGRVAQEQLKVNWRSFWNGGADGPITDLYGIRAWPTVFLIDPRGVVRYRFEGAEPQRIELALEEMLRDAEAAR